MGNTQGRKSQAQVLKKKSVIGFKDLADAKHVDTSLTEEIKVSGDASSSVVVNAHDQARPPSIAPIIPGVLNPNLEVLQTAQQVAAQIKHIEATVPRRTTTSIGKIASADEKGRAFSIKYAHVSQTGYYPDDLNKKNQDSFAIIPKLGSGEIAISANNMTPPKLPANSKATQTINPASTHFFGVFDGHGKDGDHCAAFAELNVPLKLLTSSSYLGGDIDAGITEAYIKTNEDMHHQEKHGKFSDLMSGTTAICAIISGNVLHVANVGDSRGIIAIRKSGVSQTIVPGKPQLGKVRAEPLSIDQTPFRVDERNRVKAAGARVLTMDQIEGYRDPEDQNFGTEESDDGDPPRLWSQEGAYPGTAFTRSIGDQIAERIGVFAEPEISVRELTPDDDFILIASDGVFEFLSSQAVADIVSQYDDPLEACRAVVNEAYRLWLQYEVRTDDISAILIKLEGISPSQIPSFPKPLLPGVSSRRLEISGSFSGAPIPKHLANGEVRPVRRNLSRVKADAVGQVHFDPKELEGYILPIYKKDSDEINKIKAAVRSNFLFRHLKEEQLEKACLAMETIDIKKDQVIIRQFDEGDKFYIADSGEYDVEVAVPKVTADKTGKSVPIVGEYEQPKRVFKYETKHGTKPSFGELALMYSKPRAASVICTEAGRLWALERKAFRSIIMKTPARNLMQALRKVEVLKELPPKDLSRLADLMTEEIFEPGQYIVRQGDLGDSFYIIVEGKAEVTKIENPGDAAIKVMDLTENMYFGERSLLHDAPRAANVIAVGTEKVRCLSIHRHDFEEVLGASKKHIEKHRADRERKAVSGDVVKKRDIWKSAVFSDFKIMEASETQVGCNRYFVSFPKKSASQQMCLKVANKSTVIKEQAEELALNEIRQLKNINKDFSIFVPELVSVFQDDRLLYSLFDASIATDLGQILGKPLSMEIAKYVGFSVTLALDFLHGAGYVNRAIAPESICLSPKGTVMLTDFRYSKYIQEEKTFTICGMPEYMSPEQVSGVGHGVEADFWSVGVLVYEILTGSTPFGGEGKNEIAIYSAISGFEGNFEPIPSFKLITDPVAAAFVHDLLQPKIEERLGCGNDDAEELTLHPFMADMNEVAFIAGTFPSPLLSQSQDSNKIVLQSGVVNTPNDFPNASDDVVDKEKAKVFTNWTIS